MMINSQYVGRSWDQFETNAALFGVKSTFNEDLYTTKLERGPHMRELEKHASRIAREIEGEDTEDLHLAEVGFYAPPPASPFTYTIKLWNYKCLR
jgi:PAB1-binding protein PBP1